MKHSVFITIKKELREMLREKKSLIIILLTPLFIPLFIFLMSTVYSNIISGENTDKFNIGINYILDTKEKEILDKLPLEIKKYNSKDELDKAYETGKIVAYIVKSSNNYTIYSNKKSEDSISALTFISSYLGDYNDYLAQTYIQANNIDYNKIYNNVIVENKDLKGNNDFVNQIITMGFVFAFMAISLTAIYGATDATAGEKERGTLETFLTFPIKKEGLILGKYLAITISCIITSIISIILAIVSLKISSNMFEIYKDTSLNITFLTVFVALFIMFLYSLLISGVCISIAAKTKSYKEAQSALTPVSLITIIPVFLQVLNIKFIPVLSLVPVLSHVMILEDVLCNGISASNIINVLLMFASTIVYCIIMLNIIVSQYKSEKILFSV